MTTEERREYMRKWYADHPDYNRKRYVKKKEYIRKWRSDHPDYQSDYSRKWRSDHPNYQSDYIHKRKAEHLEYYRKYCKKRFSEDLIYRAAMKFKYYRWYDSHTPSIPSVDMADYPTKEEYVQMFQQPCVFCGEADWHKIGLDRINSSLGHIRGNLQPCCWSCNSKKRNMTNEEFRQAVADGRIKLKAVKTVKADADTPAVPAMPSMRSLLSE